MNPLINTFISIVFLIVGAVAVYTMMARLGKLQPSGSNNDARLHKIAGWIFVALFLVMCALMIGKLENYWETINPNALTSNGFHVALIVSITPLEGDEWNFPSISLSKRSHSFLFLEILTSKFWIWIRNSFIPVFRDFYSKNLSNWCTRGLCREALTGKNGILLLQGRQWHQGLKAFQEY